MKKLYITIGLVLTGALAFGQVNYQSLSGFGTNLYDINDSGNGVLGNGYYNFATNTTQVVESGVMQTQAINNDGNICGKMDDGTGNYVPAVRINGVWTLLPGIPNNVTIIGISENSKYIVGQTPTLYTTEDPKSEGFIYNRETATYKRFSDHRDLYEYGMCTGVNNNGIAVGRVDDIAPGTQNMPAYFKEDGTITLIGTGLGQARAINDNNEIVGQLNSKPMYYKIGDAAPVIYSIPAEMETGIFWGISNNGVMVGNFVAYSDVFWDYVNYPAIYHSSLGDKPVYLKNFLATQNITLDDFYGYGSSVSANGKYIAGAGINAFASGWSVFLDNVFDTAKPIKVTGSNKDGIPYTDYETLAAAFADLNIYGVGAGGVTVNVPAEYTETAPSGGFNLGSETLNATLSESTPLTIQKSGSGANPVLTANTGIGNADTVVALKGVDYVTIDSIDLQANFTNIDNTTVMTEYGYGLFNLSDTDGCQHNMIKNCTITIPDTKAAIDNEAGIVAYASIYNNITGGTVGVSPIATGTHSYNKIYGNTIKNTTSNGIQFNGINPTYPGVGNDIGGDSAATGNIIDGFGYALWKNDGTADTYSLQNQATGITLLYQNNVNVSYNSMTTANNYTPAEGKLFAYNVMGISLGTSGTGFTITAENNTIALSPMSGYSVVRGISCGAPAATLTTNYNTIDIDLSHKYNNGNTSNVHGINAAIGIGNFTAEHNAVSISGNGVTVNGIYTNARGGINITDNTISGLSAVTTAYGLNLAGTGTTANILRNKIYDFQLASTGTAAHGIYISSFSSSNSTVNIFNNFIGNLNAPAANGAAVSLSGIYIDYFANIGNKYNVYHNSIYLNSTSTGTDFNSTGIYQTYDADAANGALDLRNNIIVNLSQAKGSGYATAFRRNAAIDLNNYAETSNNNDFYVDAAGAANNKIYYDGTTAYDFAGFQGVVGARETNSLNVNPAFVDSSTSDFHLSVCSSDLNGKGTPITSVTTDIDGDARDASTPDIGADEYTPTAAAGITALSSPADAATGVSTSPLLSWPAASGATGYKLYIGTASGATDVKNGEDVGNVTTYNLSGLADNTTYYVKVSSYNACNADTAGSETSFTTGSTMAVSDLSKTNISIYPNPAKDILYISGAKAKSTEIYNLAGQKVSSAKVSNGKVDVSVLAKGTYILKVEAEGKVQNLKFIKE